MKKAGKRVLSLLLAAALMASLYGCGTAGTLEGANQDAETETIAEKAQAGDEEGLFDDESEENSAQGHWVESDISPEGMNFFIQSPVKMDDGSYVFYGKRDDYSGQLVRYSSNDKGTTWQEEELDWETQVGGRITRMSLLSDNTCVFNSLEIDANDNLESMKWWQLVDNQPVELESLRDVLPEAVQLFDRDTLLVYGGEGKYAGKASLMNLTTQEVQQEYSHLDETYTGTLAGIALDNSTEGNLRMYYTCYLDSGQALCVLDQNGNVEKRIAFLETNGGNGATDEDGNYYYVYGSGICRIAKGGSVQEQIMDDKSFQLGVSNNYPSDLTYADSTTFFCTLVSFSGQVQARLMKYEWSTEPVQKPETSILVWSLYQNSAVSMAVAEYNKAHTDSEVVYQIGMEDELTDEESLLHQLNASLIAGNGPDVLILDGLDYENYCAKGFLADISDAVDKSTLLPGVSNPFFDEKGACYALPARFSVPVLMGDAGDVDELTTLKSMEEAVLAGQPRPADDLTKDAYYEAWSSKERYAFGFYNLEQLVDFTLRTSAPALTENDRLSHENLLRVMKFIDKIGGYYQINSYPDTVMSNCIGAGSGETDSVFLEDGGYEYGVTKHARYGWGNLTTPAFFAEGRRGRQDETLTGNIVLQPGLVEGAFFPSTILGVASSSKQQEEAKQFVAIMLGETVQNSNFDDGNPVLESALDQRINKHRDYVEQYGYKGDMKALYNSLKTPVTITGNTKILRDYMLSHAKDMLDGNETPEAAVTKMEQEVWVMFEEQR